MNEINKDELAEMSGETSFRRPARYVVPLISLNGNEGKFYKNVLNDEGSQKEALGDKEIKGTILKIRRVLTQFGKDERYYTNEHDSWKDKLILFHAKNGKIDRIDEGVTEAIRNRHQELRYTSHIYFLMNEEVVKLVVRGSSVGNFIEFTNGEFKSDEHLFDYEIKITPSQQENEALGTKYYAMSFEKGDKIEDLTEVAEKMKEVSNAIKRQNDYYKKPEDEEKEDEVKSEKLPVVDLEEVEEDEEKDKIDVQNIPF